MSALDPFDPLRYGFSDGDAAFAFAHWSHNLPPGWQRRPLYDADEARGFLARALERPDEARHALAAWHRFVDEELWNLTLRPAGTLSDDDLVHVLTHHLPGSLGWAVVEHALWAAGGAAGAAPAAGGDGLEAAPPVAAEPEPAWLSVAYHYADGAPVAEAPFEVRFADGATHAGTLGADGRARLDGLPPQRAGQAVEVRFGESPHAWALKSEHEPTGAPNPHHRPGPLDAALMGSVGLLASADAGLPLGRPASYFDTAPADDDEGGVLDWIWGVLLGEFEEDPTTGQVIAGAIITMIPGIDQVADVRDLGAYLYKFSSDEASRTDAWVWAGLVATGVGVVPVVGSPVKGVLKLLIKGAREGSEVTRSAVLDVVRYFGRGDAEAFVQRHLDAARLERQALEAFAEAAEKARRIFAWVAGHAWASAEAKAAARAGLRALAAVERAAPRMIARAVRRLRERLERALKGDGDEAASGSVNAYVEARAPERAPPDLEVPPEPQVAIVRFRPRYLDHLAEAEQAVRRSGASRHGMTDRELSALFAYTLEHPPYYKEANAALRRLTTMEDGTRLLIEDVSNALQKLPSHEGFVLRGADLPAAVAARYVPGRTVTEEAFTSTSIDRPFPGTYQFQIKSKTGKHIDGYSKYPEGEVLFAPGTSFKVLERRTVDQNTVHIVLEEVR